jgi:hypothetical protein
MSALNFLFDDQGNAFLYQNGKIVASASNVSELEKKAGTDFGGQGITGQTPLPPPSTTQTSSPGSGPCPGCNGQGCASCNFTGSHAGAAANSPGSNPTSFNPMNIASKKKKCEYCDDQGCHRCESDDPTQTDDITEVLKHRSSSKHYITTPNGIKGQIVSATKGIWGDEVTVRFDNGRIAKLDVVPGSDYKISSEEEDPEHSPYRRLWAKLNEMPSGTKESLINRIGDLKTIQLEAKTLIHTANYIDEKTLDEIITIASHEIKEAAEAIEAIDDSEPFEPSAPYGINVYEQESIGGHDSTWLDTTLAEMIEETEAQDFDKMMEEGPEEFVSGLNDAIISDTGEVRALAASFVDSKTVGIEKEAKKEFKTAFLARVEEVRRNEEKERRAKVVKQAKKKEIELEGDFLTDEQLFL